MFFNAHTYYSIQRSGNPDPVRILGAILADAALTGAISWTDLHDRGIIEKFGIYLGEGLPEKQLLLGLQDHYLLDVRSHDAFGNGIGYAFSHQNLELLKLVTQACGIESPKQARGLTHNFIESGVDMNLLSAHPEIQPVLREALRKVNINWAAKYLAAFFDEPEEETVARLTQYVGLILKYDLSTMDDWVSLWLDIVRLLLNHDADRDGVEAVLLLATKLTSSDYDQVVQA